VVEEGGLDEELGEGSSLNVVVVGLGDPSHPGVRRAVGGDVEVEGLEGRAMDNRRSRSAKGVDREMRA